MVFGGRRRRSSDADRRAVNLGRHFVDQHVLDVHGPLSGSPATARVGSADGVDGSQSPPREGVRAVSNLEDAPAEVDCGPGPGADIEILTPRDVPLGGPRAMTVRRTLPSGSGH